jgi:hypothetical protein
MFHPTMFGAFKANSRMYIMGAMLGSLMLIRLLSIPEKEKKIIIDDETDEGKILRADEYAKKVYTQVKKVCGAYPALKMPDFLSSDGNNEVFTGKNATTIQSLITKKHPDLKDMYWKIAFSDPDIDYGTDENQPLAVVLYHISESFTGSYPRLYDNVKDKYIGNADECLKEARDVATGRKFIDIPEEEEEKEQEDDSQDDNSDVGFF